MENPIYLQYGQDAKLPTALNYYIPKVKSLTVESEYGKKPFQEMNQIREVVQQRIKKDQRLQKKHVKKSVIT